MGHNTDHTWWFCYFLRKSNDHTNNFFRGFSIYNIRSHITDVLSVFEAQHQIMASLGGHNYLRLYWASFWIHPRKIN